MYISLTMIICRPFIDYLHLRSTCPWFGVVFPWYVQTQTLMDRENVKECGPLELINEQSGLMDLINDTYMQQVTI